MMTQPVLFLLQTSSVSSSKSPILGYIPIVLLLLFAFLLPLLLWAVSGLLNRKVADEDQPVADELLIPSSGSSERFPARFFVLGILYLVFAAQVVFILPWAVLYDRLALFGLVEMLVFMLFVGIGYYYAWYTGALKEPDATTD